MNPVQWMLLRLIRVYQLVLSPFIGNQCRFTPTCSHYAHEAISRYGARRGAWLAIRRVGRCHPWHPGGYDPVPDSPENPPGTDAPPPR